MKKYIQVMKGTIAEYMMYRLNFVMWRLRMVMQLLVTYFLWWAIFTDTNEVFGYTQTTILTYILLGSMIRTLVLGTTTMDVGSLINNGNLSNYLVRPVHFFKYYIAKDIADKGLNFVFAIMEVVALYLIFQPPLFIQTNPWLIVLTILTACMGAIMYFWFSMSLSLLGFWTPEIWGPRFISFIVMEFFAGSLFPLDILPGPLFAFSQILPFSYFLYFPTKVYLGTMSELQVLQGLLVGGVWVFLLWAGCTQLWKKGLRVYTAEGK